MSLTVRSFDEILAIAINRKGSLTTVETSIPTPAPATVVEAVEGDRWLSALTQNVFRAGFNRDIINQRWPLFETAFMGFDLQKCARMSDRWFDELMDDVSIVRNAMRIRSVQRNAVLVLEETARHGSFGAFLTRYKSQQFAELIEYLHANGSRLGDKTVQYFLREMGVDGYVLSFDVIHRLSLEGVADRVPLSKTQRRRIQSAFDEWQRQSGKNMTYISKVLAMSVEQQKIPRFGH